MRRVSESTFVTPDGVISSPEKWGSRYWGEEGSAYGLDLLFSADAPLLGRHTQEGFAETWPTRDASWFDGEYAVRINGLPKYVASRTLEQATRNTMIIEGVAEAVAELKAKTGQNILRFGTGDPHRPC